GAAITGGAINGTPIGNITPSTGKFTTLSSTGDTSLGSGVGAIVDIGTGGDSGAITLGRPGGVVRLNNLTGTANASIPAPVNGNAFDRLVLTNADGTIAQASLAAVVGNVAGTTAWSLMGNAITNPGTGAGQTFFGTTNSQPIIIATNGTQRLRISADGALNVLGPSSFDMLGGSAVNNSMSTNDRVIVADSTGTLGQVAPSALFANLSVPVNFGGGISTTTLTTSGAATLNSLAVTNNATVGGTLGVTGATTLTGALTANSGLTLNNLATGVTTNDLLVIDGSNVVKRIAAANFTTGNNWSLTGNAATTAGTNFLGTTDNTDMVFKTNNAEAMRVLNSGNVRIGTTTSTYGGGKLEIIADSTTGVFVNQRASGGGTGYSFDSNYGEFLRWSRFGGKAFSMAANGVDGALVISGSNTLNFTVPGILIGGVDTTYPLPARLQVNSTAAADKVLVLKGFAAQSGNLLEFQSSAGSVIASVNAAGAVTAPNLSLTNLATGVTSNDVLVIDGSNVVKRIPASSFASGTNWSLTG
ncbi:MAG: hypothetical protein EBR15_07315, partial [Gammaproteobacteria bacterium]|nr:hypothetical protein [Gammaproteobacteria bacterium]